MRSLRKILFTGIILICASAPVYAADDTRTGIFNADFQTLQLKVNGDDMVSPILILGSDDVLTVSFDEISPERRYLRYSLTHCDSRWRPDGLVATEYLTGFNEAEVEDYCYSQATVINYVNYSITLPDEKMRFTKSGNYLLKVYDESEPDMVLLQARFCVVEPMMNVSATVSSRTDVDYNESHQQLTVSVDTRGTGVNNYYTDVLVCVEQNGRADNEVALTSPSRMAGNVLWFEHRPELIFKAGNEYRRMEIVSTTYPGMGVDSYTWADPYYHALLLVDTPRSDEPYAYDTTQHGRRRIRSYDSDEPDCEAEYVVTHFSLEMPEFRDVDIFIDGDLAYRRFDADSRMVFNRATGRYEHSMLLKQGAYNYQYLVVPKFSSKGSTAEVEGDKYATVNEYTVRVYTRMPGERYDRLVAVTKAFSGR
ncbi:MAG: DUF5103 domain-containing protein [Paramuribaculum sp.]|nr:DUF5103 domain-containing protein [Paramuribaculum sp.]